jgi:hypothetical protein
MNFDFGQITRYFERLAPRERLLLGLAVASTLIIFGYSFVWDPLQAGAEQLARRISVREKDLQAIQEQHDHYLEVLRQLEAYGDMSEIDPNFNLLGYLQGVVAQAVSREKITSLNPTTRPKPEAPEFIEEIIDIKLTQVGLPQIVDLMYRVEKGEHPLRFSRISIKKRFNDQYNFDVHATISVLKTAEKAPEKAPEGGTPGRSGGA